ncbi:MFS transporter [Pantanalinema sp. GBBB05]|uniref:MFS transporter n=1 Tax=Pantanalinema sp. GBBB05 TaxID=2604139 RepID=UPI001D6703D3|nr:MFS transporter [Pantanalinema sp. GBBB05]
MPRQRWIGVALSFYAFIAIGMAEGGLGILIPSIQTTYHLTPATVTLLFLSQLSGYIVAAIASSLLSSRLGLARMLLLAAALLTSALMIYAFSPIWSVMVAAGILLGLGIGLIDAGINTYIASDQRHADLTGILHAFYGIGALLGPALATTLLAIDLNWRQVYQVFAAVVVVLMGGLGWAVVCRYAPMRRQATHSAASASLNLRVALRTPIVIMAALLLMIYVGMESAVGNWAYSVQAVGRGTPEMLAGYSVSAYWFGLTLGRLVMGRLVRRLGADRLLDWSLGLLAIGLLMWWQLPNAWLVLPVIGFALGPIFPTTIWLMPQRVATALVPAAIGFMTSVASLGAATIPTSMGWFATRTSLEIVPALLLPLAGLLIGLHRCLVRWAPTNPGL